ncbi:MAG TPA: peroxidase-related enzyme [Actinomycetota bacterium]|nr:peroxidase-related enzyme [Actinomycetota bacterium]
MYLEALESGHRARARVALWLAQVVGGSPIDDVGKTCLYRPEIFGRSFLRLVRQLLRGPSEWSVGERELFAAFVSRLNRCSYCAEVHSRVAATRLGEAVALPAFDSWRESDYEPRVKAVFYLLERLTLCPQELTTSDVDSVRLEGVSDAALTDAIYIAAVFNLVNRLADALGFSWRSESEADKAARVLSRLGYRLPPFMLK